MVWGFDPIIAKAPIPSKIQLTFKLVKKDPHKVKSSFNPWVGIHKTPSANS